MKTLAVEYEGVDRTVVRVALESLDYIRITCGEGSWSYGPLSNQAIMGMAIDRVAELVYGSALRLCHDDKAGIYYSLQPFCQ